MIAASQQDAKLFQLRDIMKRNGLLTGLSALRALTVLAAISLSTAHAQNATRATTIQATQLRKALQQAGSLPIQVPPGAVIRSGTVLTPDGATVTLAAAGAADPDADPQRATQRKAVLSKLTFDRRPSAILKAWSTPPKKEGEPETDPAADKEGPKDGGPEEGAAEETTPEEKPLTEAEKKAKEEAEKTKAAAEKLAKEMEQLKADVETLKRNVTLANWSDVGEFIGSLEEDESKALYLKLLQSLLAGPPGQPKARSGQIIGERNVIRASDVIALAELCPVDKLEDTHISSLARLASLCQAEGQAEYIFLQTLEAHVAAEGEKKLDQRSAARILFMAGRIDQANSFLPEIAAADADEDLEALSILTDVFFRKYQLESDKSYLEQSWQAAQLLLSAEKADEAQQRKAMQRCVQLVPLIKEELGQQWLTDSFTSEPQQGMEIIAGIGGASAESMKLQLNRPSERVATLKLQQTAVNALLAEAPDKAESWGGMLHLLAANWLREATYSRKYDSTTSRGPTMTRDMYGNYFYSGTSRSSSPPQGIPV